MTPEYFRVHLESKSNVDLRGLAKRIGLVGYSSLKRTELIDLILTVDTKKLKKEIDPSWWSHYHNHVYGVIGVLAFVLSIVFYFVPPPGNGDPYLNGSRRVVDVLEAPIGFVEYSIMNQLDRATIFNLHVGKEVTWEGYIVSFMGFVPGALGEFPFEKPIGIVLTPRKQSAVKIMARFSFEPVHPTDGGYELMSQLYGLKEGQRLRMTGRLGGSPEQPILTDSQISRVFAIDE